MPYRSIETLCRSDQGVVGLINKAEPYIPPQAAVYVEKVKTFFDKSTDANITKPRLVEQLASYHPILEKIPPYVPEFNKANLFFVLLLLLCWEGITGLH